MSSSYFRRSRSLQREVQRGNADTNVIGAELEISEEVETLIRETNQNDIDIKTKKNYRNRISEICTYWQNNQPAYFLIGSYELSAEEKADPNKFYHKNTRDIIYNSINHKFFLAFLAEKKNLPDGKLASYTTIRKYNDAILWGCHQANESLPLSYIDGVNAFLRGYKKETIKAKMIGNLNEEEADAIPFDLFICILTWALESNNIFVWVFTILQWNFIARSIDIGVLSLRNIRMGVDCLICKYDKSKADQTGERCHDKHFYSNPFMPVCDVFGALGVFLSLERDRFSSTDYLFKYEGTTDKSASARYCSQLRQLFIANTATVATYIRPDHADSHGLRKGAATASSSGTTCPPPVSSLAARGEWCISAVLSIYWQFADAGDNYLGRCLAGLDPNSDTFAALPPHFSEVDMVNDVDYLEAMTLMFGPILDNPTFNSKAVLSRLLCAVIYNFDFYIAIKNKYPGHSFTLIPLMNNPSLVDRLKNKITIQPRGQITTATGIPPHVSMAIEVRRVLNICQDTLQEVKAVQSSISTTINDAIEKRAVGEGHMTSARLNELLDGYHTNLQSIVSTQLISFRTEIINNIGRPPMDYHENPNSNFHSNDDDFVTEENSTVGYQSYNYDGKLGFHVPSQFQFPEKTKIRNAWSLWWQGCTTNQGPIRPFRLIKVEYLPKSLKSNFRINWQPILKLMTDGVTGEAQPYCAEWLNSTYLQGLANVKKYASYIFNGKQDRLTVASWSKKICPSEIRKYGSEDDKRLLQEANTPTTHHRNSRVSKKRKRNQRNVIIVPRRAVPLS